LRGGDGNGGAYNWDSMPLVPDCNTSDAELQAIGALCHDAGISVNMSYGPNGSGAMVYKAREALLNTFGYSNAVNAILNYYCSTETFHDLGLGLRNMVNPNLDAGNPAILGIIKTGAFGAGHTILTDGYGYDASTEYHHLNMGLSGKDDVWYNLPDIDPFNVINECVYNIFTSGTGEIVSGRVTDEYGKPIRGALVTGTRFYRDLVVGTLSDETNDNGIYAISGLGANTDNITQIISVSKEGYNFEDKEVILGESINGSHVSGNIWGIDFNGTSQLESSVGLEMNKFDLNLHDAMGMSNVYVTVLQR
jgi:hypothetical protein